MREERHITRFMRMDDRVQKARQHRGWRDFHRQCGEAGLFFDHIEKQGRGYHAVAFRVERRGEFFASFVLARGSGREPIDAVLSAFHEAVKVHPRAKPELADLLSDGSSVSIIPDDLDALLGGAPATEIMDLIG